MNIQVLLNNFQDHEQCNAKPTIVRIETQPGIEYLRVCSDDAEKRLVKVHRMLNVRPVATIRCELGNIYIYDFLKEHYRDLEFEKYDINF